LFFLQHKEEEEKEGDDVAVIAFFATLQHSVGKKTQEEGDGS
jgi:hypothetical protein